MSASQALGIRIPEPLKERLTKLANINEHSLNREIILHLERSVSEKSNIMENILNIFDIQKIQRMRSSSTSSDADRLVKIIRNLEIDKIILGAKKDELNNAVMVAIVHTPSIILVIDNTKINMARTPREWEVQQIFKTMDKYGLLGTLYFFKSYLPETSNLSPDDALSSLLSSSEVRSMNSLSNYLDLLSVHKHYDKSEYRH